MKKVMIVFGTRPEAIKMSPIINVLKKQDNIETKVCVTGQHKQMLFQVLKYFNIEPDYDLDIMKKRQTLYDVTQNVLLGVKEILERERPNIVLVHGDTTTTFATALGAFYLQIPVGHVEAGLRTKNIFSPFPEEFNRKATAIVTAMHFAPTSTARDNLISEGYNSDNIYVTGNTAIDALQTTVKSNYNHEILEWVGSSRLILVTAHRRENLGVSMQSMFKAIRRVACDVLDVKIVYPVHLNPKVLSIAYEILGDHERIRLIEPLNVYDFHNFMDRSYLILTDSGGIQEEAPSLGKPVLVMRDTTERPEGVAAGTLMMAGTNEQDIYSMTMQLLQNKQQYDRMSKAQNPYGDGHASERIVDAIINRSDI